MRKFCGIAEKLIWLTNFNNSGGVKSALVIIFAKIWDNRIIIKQSNFIL